MAVPKVREQRLMLLGTDFTLEGGVSGGHVRTLVDAPVAAGRSD